MADKKQSDENLSMEIEEESTAANDKVNLRRTTSESFGSLNISNDSDKFVISSINTSDRKSKFTPLVAEQHQQHMRSKSTSTCSRSTSSSTSDDDLPSFTKRTRTFSDSNQFITSTLNVDCSNTSPSPIPIGSPAPRVLQLKREESVDELTREVAKERDVTSAINLSRSWDETSWLGDKNYSVISEGDKRDGLDELMFASFTPSLSSPVRFVDKVNNHRSLTPSPIATPISPKQRKFRRSLSPSHLRPTLLSSKRKLDPEELDTIGTSPAKRTPYYSPMNLGSISSTNSSPDYPSDTNLCSCDEDSGNEHSFIPHNSVNSHANLLTCDTRQNVGFTKPRYVAPQSPLAAGVHKSTSNDTHRQSTIGTATYAFTPVKTD